jgi:hypothetical protein
MVYRFLPAQQAEGAPGQQALRQVSRLLSMVYRLYLLNRHGGASDQQALQVSLQFVFTQRTSFLAPRSQSHCCQVPERVDCKFVGKIRPIVKKFCIFSKVLFTANNMKNKHEYGLF